MIQNIFSNIQSMLVKNRYTSTNNNVPTPTWQGALVAVAVVGIPWLLAVRAQSTAAGRVEAKNLDRELSSDSNNCSDQIQEQEKESNNNEGQDDNTEEEVVDNASIKEAIEQQLELDANAAPFHFNMRIPARLKGAGSTNNILNTSGRNRVFSRSSSRGSSRSTSPTPELQLHSSSSSLAEDLGIPLDTLTDRKGFEELDSSSPHTMVVLSKLPAVNERLSEDSLEDVHAFSDLTLNNSSRSIQNNLPPSSDNSYLETLDEEGDSFDDNDADVVSSPVVIPTIMEDNTTQVVFELLDSTTTASTELVQ